VGTGFSSTAWTEYLSRELGAPVVVSYGRARSQVLVARPTASGYRVRMHAGFAAAPPEVRAATARWLSSGRRARKASALLDTWIEDVLVPSIAAAVEPAGATDRAHARGAHHDLAQYADELLPRHIDAALLPPEKRPAITWGRRLQTGARRSLHLGTYDGMQRRVRIHRVLDQLAVPAFFVRYVLFHELLHAAIPARRDGGRTVHHGPEFRRRERAYQDFERAKRWEDENIERLLRSTRTGKPLRGGGWVQGLLFDL
jgi:hypothetical protein